MESAGGESLRTSGDLRGTWLQALASLAFALLALLSVRWALFEPYVIPSGSMLPTLLIRDHIFVNKFAYGIRFPFSSHYFIRWSEPKKGDVVVFRSVESDDVFLVKRIVGVAGDKVFLRSSGPETGLELNGIKVPVRDMTPEETQKTLSDWTPDHRAEAIRDYKIQFEHLGDDDHALFRDLSQAQSEVAEVVVPEGRIFASGDNRDHSSDSRIWGTLPVDRILGRASIVWLSCEEALADTEQLCDPRTIRWNRFGRKVH